MKIKLDLEKIKKNKGCGRKFLMKRFLRKPTFFKDNYKTFIYCGDNLSNSLCPECKENFALQKKGERQ